MTEVRKLKQGRCRGETRFEIIQHEYATAEYSYVECLEINNPPVGYNRFIVHYEDIFEGSLFIEWETLDDAINAFKKFWPMEVLEKHYSRVKGFKRYVACGSLTPWFYATPKQEIKKDFVFSNEVKSNIFLKGKSST